MGEERYRDACAWAWETASGAGRCGGLRSWPGRLDEVPHEFAHAWWHSDASLTERLEMGLRLYREMPCYANTMELKSFYGEFGPEDRRMFWDAYRAALDCDDDRLADPVAYSLWVDFFEDPSTVHEAWRETTWRGTEPWERRVARVLDVAGPVPWASKEELFEQLGDQSRWHGPIFRALFGSAFDVYGQIGASARDWLDRLGLAPDTPDLAALRARLAAP